LVSHAMVSWPVTTRTNTTEPTGASSGFISLNQKLVRAHQ
jgi:hypothetical protein